MISGKTCFCVTNKYFIKNLFRKNKKIPLVFSLKKKIIMKNDDKDFLHVGEVT